LGFPLKHQNKFNKRENQMLLTLYRISIDTFCDEKKLTKEMLEELKIMILNHIGLKVNEINLVTRFYGTQEVKE
jgi:hypothetical protein